MAHRSMNSYLRGITFGVMLLSAACTSDTQEKLGYDGEFCAKDNDCRSGHLCNRGACEELATPQRDECEGLCGKLSACGRTEQDCASRCVQTLSGWSEEALVSFSTCTLDTLTCEDAQDGQAAANFCYRRIPLDPTRQMRCDTFDATARSIDPTNSAALDELFDKCYRLARVGTEANWGRTEACQELLNNGEPMEDIKDCLNQVFALDAELKVSVMTPEVGAP